MNEKNIFPKNDKSCGKKISLWRFISIKNEFLIPAMHCKKNAMEKNIKYSLAKSKSVSIKKDK